MRRKPLPKAITRPLANLQKIAAGFAADEQGRVPRHTIKFDAVEPEPVPEAASKPAEQSQRAQMQQTDTPDPLAARRRAFARRIVGRPRNYGASTGEGRVGAISG